MPGSASPVTFLPGSSSQRHFFVVNFALLLRPKLLSFVPLPGHVNKSFSLGKFTRESEREVAIFCCGTQRACVSVQKESTSYICLQVLTSAHKTWQLNPPHVLCSRKSALFRCMCHESDQN